MHTHIVLYCCSFSLCVFILLLIFLATFDVQEMFLSTSLSGSFLPEISYKLEFMRNSLAVGALIMFLLKNTDYDCQRSSFFLQNRESAEEFNNFTQGLSDGSYVVRVYDVEGNGEIFSNEPALRKTIVIRGSGKLFKHENFDIQTQF